MKVTLITLLATSGLLWIGLVATLLWVQSNDPLSRRIAEPFAEFVTIGIWLLLAIITLAVVPRAGTSAVALISALVLLAFSFVAAFVTIQLFGRQAAPGWLMVVPALPPILFGVLAVLAASPNRPAMQLESPSRILLGVILGISMLPWFFAIRSARQNAAEVRRLEALRAGDK